MGWNNFTFAGDGSNPQADNAETATIDELGESSMTLPNAIKITDILADKTTTESHQIRIFVNGKAQLADVYSSQINPASDGRRTWGTQNIVVPAGATFQLKGSQKSGATAETFKVQIIYEPA